MLGSGFTALAFGLGGLNGLLNLVLQAAAKLLLLQQVAAGADGVHQLAVIQAGHVLVCAKILPHLAVDVLIASALLLCRLLLRRLLLFGRLLLLLLGRLLLCVAAGQFTLNLTQAAARILVGQGVLTRL